MNRNILKPRILRKNLRTWGPLVIFSCVMGLWSFLTFPVCDWYMKFGTAHDTMLMAAFGGPVGMLLFSTLVAGWIGRSWLSGLTFGSVAAAATFALVILGASMCSRILIMGPNASGISSVFLTPLLTLCGAIPFYLLRFSRSCFLTRDPSAAVRSPRRTEDLFVVTSVIAACLLFTRLPAVVWGARATEFYPTFLIATGTFTLLSLFSVFLWSLRLFTAKTNRSRLVIYFRGPLLFLLMFVAAIRAWEMFTGKFSSGLETIKYFLPAVLSASVALGAGLFALHRCGYRLVWPQVRGPGIKDSFDDRKYNRVIAAGLLLLAVGTGLAQGRIQSTRRFAWMEQHTLSELTAEFDGHVVVDGSRHIVGVQLGTGATNVTLEQFAHLRRLRRLRLSGSSVSDAGLATVNSFPNLEVLDLSATPITSASVSTLAEIKTLSSLSLAKNKLTSNDVLEILNAQTLADLDVSAMRLSEEQLAEIAAKHGGSLTVSGYGFDDESLATILAAHEFDDDVITQSWPRSLDLSGNRISGACLRDYPEVLYDLKLNETEISDGVFGPVSEDLKVARLHIADTLLTDRFLASFEKAKNIKGLSLGAGRISEKGLAQLKRVQLRFLAMNAKQFTGECFETWKPRISQLDMSGSGLNDSTVRHLKNLPSCQIMDVSNTKITDAALLALEKLSIHRLNLANTEITADGLMRANLSMVSRVEVAFQQFTDQEIRRIRDAGISLYVGGAQFPDSMR